MFIASITTIWFEASISYLSQQFDFCNKISDIIIPDSVQTIGSRAFAQYGNASVTGLLTEVHIGSGVTSIGDRAFYPRTSNSETITDIYIDLEEENAPAGVTQFKPWGTDTAVIHWRGMED